MKGSAKTPTETGIPLFHRQCSHLASVVQPFP